MFSSTRCNIDVININSVPNQRTFSLVGTSTQTSWHISKSSFSNWPDSLLRDASVHGKSGECSFSYMEILLANTICFDSPYRRFQGFFSSISIAFCIWKTVTEFCRKIENSIRGWALNWEKKVAWQSKNNNWTGTGKCVSIWWWKLKLK